MQPEWDIKGEALGLVSVLYLAARKPLRSKTTEIQSVTVEGHDAVLSSFGPNALLSSTLRRDFGRALAAAMRESGVRRLELVSSALLFEEQAFYPAFSR